MSAFPGCRGHPRHKAPTPLHRSRRRPRSPGAPAPSAPAYSIVPSNAASRRRARMTVLDGGTACPAAPLLAKGGELSVDVATKVIEFLTAVVGLVAAVSAIPKVRRLQCKKRKGRKRKR